MTQATSPNPPKLLDQVRDRLRVKHYSLLTEKQYLNWIRRFILFHGKRHPKEMGATEVEAFLTHLAVGTRALRHRNASNGSRVKEDVEFAETKL